jgi:hypothetical protein
MLLASLCVPAQVVELANSGAQGRKLIDNLCARLPWPITRRQHQQGNHHNRAQN